MGKVGGDLRHKAVEGSGSLLKLSSRTSMKNLSHNPLRKLRDLDSASPQFHEQFVNFLRGREYRNTIRPTRRGFGVARRVPG